MGYMTAYDMAGQAGLKLGLEHHFKHNCFPSIPMKYMGAALKAIEICVNSEFHNKVNPDKKIRIPNQGSMRIYATPNEIVEDLRLDAFVDYEIDRIKYETQEKKNKRRRK